MERNNVLCLLFLHMLGILACFVTTSNAVESDIDCLRSIKESLEDSKQAFSTWDFSNNTEGFICRFVGVRCWSDEETRVFAISLQDAGLRGLFPVGIRNCTSMLDLDLSGNHISGSIPDNLANDLPYIVALDFSNNNLSGPIPPSIANFTFISYLRLDNNHLTGQIPSEFSKLRRLREFSVANNKLSGPIPTFPGTIFSEQSYANNLGLYVRPLSRRKKENTFLSGFVVGFPASTILCMMFMFYFSPRLSTNKTRLYLMIQKIKGMKRNVLYTKENVTEESKITSMGKYVRKLSLVELEMATDYFDDINVIGYGSKGLMYKAVFLNGLTLAVKRLHKFETFEKEFLLEIEILGRLRHTNLVPLLGFCYEMEKKFMVYKYMCNGTLHQWLHSRPQVEGRKIGWPIRLRIAIGIARGLAWLHHNNVLRVAHLKMSSNCILLDDKFEPKISNFGDSNILMNTSGTPSSACHFVLPHSSLDPYKVDVYRFGILLLELVSGKERSYEHTDSDSDSSRDSELNVIDECLTGQGFDEEIYETLRIAENCIHTHKDGATSMLQVYQAIRAIGKSRNDDFVDTIMDAEPV
ncbi:hypothetical protein QVD17_07800 [Tagetes erecta]|uniref:Protein kinase domain-containing protein n=1 Tax=Tagetes erecta TaxID=13708 RepID=A0AAD8P2T6_TARER|nr:hypothetical protein QVD17_07800 [Tagetes erecta]